MNVNNWKYNKIYGFNYKLFKAIIKIKNNLPKKIMNKKILTEC